ncbi:MAG TPA: hypothetical protein VF458_19700 [Ktedonobacteraceae bacterium]
MSSEQALLTCTFNWGKTCSLYYDSIEIAGKAYNLKDLTSIHPSYRMIFGVPSARLELSFGGEHLVLRGIAELDIARLMVSHLQPYCPTPTPGAHVRSRSSRARNLARAQARAWERTGHIPAVLERMEEREFTPRTSDLLKHTDALGDTLDSTEEAEVVDGITLDSVPKAPISDTSLTSGETMEAFARLASNLSTYASPLPDSIWQPLHTPRFQPPLHSVHLIPPHQKFDSGSMPVPAVKSSVLPIIHVPVRLLHGECAHYSIGATLCSDRISSSDGATYPLLDQGLLILTNRRVLYIGKRCQFTLAYTHLWYVSLLHTAIALHIEGQFRRIIIELEHPHEWASRIELLSFIARRERPEPPTRSIAAVAGLNMTFKRPAIKPPAAKPAPVDVTTLPLLSERAASIAEACTIEIEDEALQACADRETLDFPGEPTAAKIVEARTIEVEGEALQSCADHETLDFPSEPVREPSHSALANALVPDPPDANSSNAVFRAPGERSCSRSLCQSGKEEPSHSALANAGSRSLCQSGKEEPLELVKSNTPRIAACSAQASESKRKAGQEARLENIPTQDMPLQADVTEIPTREFSPLTPEPELADAPTQAISRLTDVTTFNTSEIAPPVPQPELADAPTRAISRQSEKARRAQPPEPSTEDLSEGSEDDDRTIHLNERKLCQLRTVSMRTAAPARPPDSQITDKRLPRVRAGMKR